MTKASALPPKVKQEYVLYSNVQSVAGAPWERTLRQFNVVCGPPESGKTAAVRALSLALTGQVEDTLGREVSDARYLRTLGRPGVLLSSSLVGPGGTWRWVCPTNGKAQATGPDTHALNVVFPVTAVRAALGSGAAKATSFFSGLLPAAHVSDLPLAEAQALVREALAPCTGDLGEVTADWKLIEKERKAALASVERRLEQHKMAAPVSPKELEAAAGPTPAVVEAAKTILAAVRITEASAAHAAQRQRYVVQKKDLDDYEAVLAETTHPDEAWTSALVEMVKILPEGENACVLCGAPDKGLKTTKAAAAGYADWLNDQQHGHTVAVVNVNSARGLLASIREKGEAAAALLTRCQAEHASAIAAMKAAGLPPGAAQRIVDTAAQAPVGAADIAARQAAYAAKLAALDDVARAQASYEEAKAVRAYLEAQVKRVFSDGKLALEDRVSDLLRLGTDDYPVEFIEEPLLAALFVTEDGGRELPSGWHTARVHLALAAVLAMRACDVAALAGEAPPLFVLCPEDRQTTPGLMVAWMETLRHELRGHPSIMVVIQTTLDADALSDGMEAAAGGCWNFVEPARAP